jgi:hypothetical protein
MFDFDSLHSAILELRSKQVFFVCGAIKSGTTWVQLLLDAHPEIGCSGEGHFPNHLAPLLAGALRRHNELIAGKNASVFQNLPGAALLSDDDLFYVLGAVIALALVRQAKDKRVRAVGEKTPDNIRHLPLLAMLFPAAKFIHVVRDGRDCAISGWFHNLRVNADWTRQSFASMDAYVRNFAEVWAAEIGAARRFAEGRTDSYIEIRYEDLLSHGSDSVQNVFRFLGVDAGSGIASECLAAASFEKLSGGRPRGEEDRNSFFRRGTAGDWRMGLDDAMKSAFYETAGEWLARLRYPRQ